MPFARQVGQRVRRRRLDVGMKLKQLADRIGVSTQQVQRYESGEDNIYAWRLANIAVVLEASPGSFFPPDGAGAETDIKGVVTDEQKLLRAFASIRGKNHREQVIDFVETFARHQTSWASRHKQLFCW